MPAFEDSSFSFEDFPGKVRLFPLPNLVLFPHVMQPLHVFEPRYRELLEDALKGDRLIAMAVLAPGWEGDYEGRPPLYPVACLGWITACRRLNDSTYNVLLLGLRRVRLLREVRPARSFREAEVELCEECDPPARTAAAAALRRGLREALLGLLPSLPEAQAQLDQLLSGDVSLGLLTDAISYMLGLDVRDKVALLAETDVRCRAELLLEQLSAAAANCDAAACRAAGFPPRFSAN
jgi:Lon protease-like protein